jgi:hypothetical protein
MEGAVASGGGAATGGLRPLGVGETLDAAIKLYRSNAVTLWKIVAVIAVPLQVIDVIVRRISLPGDVILQDGQLYTFSGSSGAGSTVALILVVVLGLLAALLSNGATFKVVLDAYLGRSTDWRESIAFARHRLLSLLWLGILITVLVVIGFVLLVIPGLWLIVAVSVAVPALMLEGVGGFAAIKRSMQLVDGRWWATLLRLIAALLLYGVLTALVSLLIRAIANGIHNVTLFLVLGGVLAAIASVIATPFIASVITVIYIDLRVRKEALDIELLAAGFGGPGSTVPAAAPTAETSTPPPAPVALPPAEPTWPPAG